MNGVREKGNMLVHFNHCFSLQILFDFYNLYRLTCKNDTHCRFVSKYIEKNVTINKTILDVFDGFFLVSRISSVFVLLFTFTRAPSICMYVYVCIGLGI